MLESHVTPKSARIPGVELVELPPRRAEPLRPQARDPLEARERPLDVALLLVVGHPVVGDVRVAVVPELVAGGDDGLDHRRVEVGGEAGHEERRAQTRPLEHPHDARHADLRPIGLVAHRREPADVLRVDGEDGRLRVDVERQRERGTVAVGPGEGRHSAGSLAHRRWARQGCDPITLYDRRWRFIQCR